MTKLFSSASNSQHENRKRLLALYRSTPIPPDELLVNLHLYMRSSVVAKMLYVDELYRRIVKLPGVVMEFGVWWGANLALFESLRAVYEPYNFTRRIIGFDTFAGYTPPEDRDGKSDYVAEGAYSVSQGYKEYLEQLLDYHESENALSQIKKIKLVEGDAGQTITHYLSDHPETIISLAYFDLQLYAPTKACLEAIRPHLVKGSIIAMDELNSTDFPGETIAFKEVFALESCRLLRSEFLPDRCYMVYGE